MSYVFHLENNNCTEAIGEALVTYPTQKYGANTHSTFLSTTKILIDISGNTVLTKNDIQIINENIIQLFNNRIVKYMFGNDMITL